MVQLKFLPGAVLKFKFSGSKRRGYGTAPYFRNRVKLNWPLFLPILHKRRPLTFNVNLA